MMPSLALGAALEPFGLGRPFLAIASASIDTLQSGAVWTAGLPHATILVASAPQIALPIAFLGILWLCLWKGRARWIGLPAALAVSLWPRPEAPVAWIDAQGMQGALRIGKEAVYMRPDDRLFAADFWSRRRGLTRSQDPAPSADGVFDCTGSYCQAAYKGHPRVSIWWTKRQPQPEILEGLCAGSDVLALRAAVDLPASCSGVQVLTPAQFAAGGSVEIYRDGRMVWAQPLRGQRPWTVSDSGG